MERLLVLLVPLAAPAAAQTTIDFELGAPCTFSSSTALTNEYAGVGVTFAGPAPGDGGCALDECGNFGVDARSGDGFLAFNRNSSSQSGTPHGPETITFASSVRSVDVWVAGGFTDADVVLEAFDGAALVAMDQVLAADWAQLSVAAPSITHVVLREQGVDASWIVDDLTVDIGFGTNYCGPAVPNSSGLPATIHASGSHVVADDALVLVCEDMPTFAAGYVLNSRDQGFVQNPGGSQGDLCLSGSVGRHVHDVMNSGASGTIAVAVDLGALPQPGGAVVVLPGETWNFTCWFRDANPTVTSNFSDAVSITFQ